MKLTKSINVQGTIVPACTELHFSNEGVGYYNGVEVQRDMIPEVATEANGPADVQSILTEIEHDGRLNGHYKLSIDKDIYVILAPKGDMPYRVHHVKPNSYVLAKGYQERTYLPMKWHGYKQKFASVKGVIDAIVAKHNAYADGPDNYANFKHIG